MTDKTGKLYIFLKYGASALLFIMVAFALYLPSFDYQWTYDDATVLVLNPDIRSWQGFWMDSRPGRPLRELTYLLDHALFGLNSAGYHFQNIFWHGLNAFFVFLTTLRLGGRKFVAWGGALIFLTHPIQVEVVANISHRKDSLVLVFALISFLCYQNMFESAKRQRWGWFLVSVITAWIAFQGKQTAVALLPMFLAYEIAFVPTENRLLLRHPKWFCGAMFIGLVSVFWWLFRFGAMEKRPWEIQGLMTKLNHFSTVTDEVYFATVLKSWAFSFSKLLYPIDLSVEYVFSVPVSWFDPWVLSSLIVLFLYVVALCFLRRRSPLLFVAVVLIGAFWLPVSNL